MQTMLNWHPVACKVIIILSALSPPSTHLECPLTVVSVGVVLGVPGGAQLQTVALLKVVLNTQHSKHSGRHTEFKMENKFLSLAGHCIL